MPGLYLALLLVSAVGLAVLDARFRLALWRTPARAAWSITIGTAFFLAWDAVGIAAGVFVKGDSPALVGIDLAPHLPIEEPVFLAFLCYLALLITGAVHNRRRSGRMLGARARGESDDQP